MPVMSRKQAAGLPPHVQQANSIYEDIVAAVPKAVQDTIKQAAARRTQAEADLADVRQRLAAHLGSTPQNRDEVLPYTLKRLELEGCIPIYQDLLAKAVQVHEVAIQAAQPYLMEAWGKRFREADQRLDNIRAEADRLIEEAQLAYSIVHDVRGRLEQFRGE